ncbi:MAG TPA: DedA family protein [Solirubrobacteraceae bacterium]|jgi:membrane protein DedA with SNARE-associated domain|nr:DedA family protein [Solirubrobacteraceae bacterium]
MTSAIARFGVLGVFLLMVPESACIPIPSEVTLLFSGFAVHQEWMSFPAAVAAATAGNLVGSLIAYALGASQLLHRVPGAGRALERSERLMQRHGSRAVLIARLLPLARTFVSVPAGAQRVPMRRFVAMTLVGCAIWAAAFITAGMIAGAAWATLSGTLGRILLAITAIVLATLLIKRP